MAKSALEQRNKINLIMKSIQDNTESIVVSGVEETRQNDADLAFETEAEATPPSEQTTGEEISDLNPHDVLSGRGMHSMHQLLSLYCHLTT